MPLGHSHKHRHTHKKQNTSSHIPKQLNQFASLPKSCDSIAEHVAPKSDAPFTPVAPAPLPNAALVEYANVFIKEV
jgi:hypothetical protein